MNQQPMQKQDLDRKGRLYVKDIFYTLQGEGPFVGTPAVFVRLAGCTLQCPLCDTDYTSKNRLLFEDVVDRVVLAAQEKAIWDRQLVVITGGEPFRQNIVPLVECLLESGYTVQIETNGTVYVPGPWEKVTIVCSPKSGEINKFLREYVTAYKYVLSADAVDPLDGLPTSALGQPQPPARAPIDFPKSWIYVQPLDDHTHNLSRMPFNRHFQAAIDSCMKHGYRLCLQTHKLLGLD